MDEKQKRARFEEVRSYLLQIALELESSTASAREAAGLLENRQAAWPHIQNMYARLQQANYLLERFRKTIDDTIKEGFVEPEQMKTGR